MCNPIHDESCYFYTTYLIIPRRGGGVGLQVQLVFSTYVQKPFTFKKCKRVFPNLNPSFEYEAEVLNTRSA